MDTLGTVVLLMMSVWTTRAAMCPETDTDLKIWSDRMSWENEEIPGEGDNVTIARKILLDQSPGVDLGSITIVTGGQLVFAPDSDLTLRAYYIEIVGGRLDIGAEDCPYVGKATIQLLGTVNDTYSVPGFGRKFLGVGLGGTLEIHGQQKLPWTKLTDTLSKMTSEAFASRTEITKDDNIKGLLVTSYNPVTGETDQPMGVFSIGSSKQHRVDKETIRFYDYMTDVDEGSVVMLAVRKFIVDRQNACDRNLFYATLETFAYGDITYSSKVRDLRFYDSYAMIMVKGNYSQTVEGFEPYKIGGLHQTSTATLLSEDTDLKYFAKSYTKSKGFGKSFVLFEVTHTEYSVPILDVSDNVNWNIGDKVVVTSTDYDWKQAEVGTVMDCESCSTQQIRVDLSPRFTHYGKIFKEVDMRAEVALLTRNIVFEGEMEHPEDEFGGHIKAMNGFKDFHIEGAEIRHMGQSTSLGNYPVHWHLCGDVADQQVYPNRTYARQNSIHSTYARCVTVHATHGAVVTDNVCYKSKGHGFFLEDGGEIGTEIRGNLGAGQMKGKLIPTDKVPSTFWITNPLTIMEDNVAAGGEGFGMWYVFPEEPMGPSKGKYMAPGEAKHTAIKRFYNNVAHSNRLMGLKIDDRLDENGTVIMNNKYQPLNDPLKPDSGDKKVEIIKLTAYKNRKANAVIRGGLIEVSQSSMSDSATGLSLRRFEDGHQSVMTSVIIGDSDNTGEPLEGLDRSVPDPTNMAKGRLGLELGYGPVTADNVWFNGFANTTRNDAGAIGFQKKNCMFSSVENTMQTIGFGFDDSSEGNRVYTRSVTSNDGDRVAIFNDEIGSVTSIPGASVVRADPFQTTQNCVVRPNWGAAVCDETFAQIFVKGGKMKTGVTMMRTDDVHTNRQTSDTTGPGVFNVITGGAYSYLLKFENKIPKDAFSLYGIGLETQPGLMVGICVPKDLTFKVKFTRPETEMGSAVSSRAEVEAGDGTKYFLDTDVGVLFLKLTNDDSSSALISRCPFGQCAGAKVTKLATSDRSQTDCVAAYVHTYGTTSVVTRGRRGLFTRSLSLPAVLPFTSRDPPTNTGAGSTRN